MLDHFQDCLKSIVCVTFIEFCKGDSQMQGDGGGGGNEELSFEDCVHKGSLNVGAPGFEVFHFNFKKHLLYHVNAWFQGFQFQIFKNT